MATGDFEARFSSLLDLIAEAPLAPGGWEPVLDGVADFVGGQAADLTFFDLNPVQIARTETSRVDQSIYGRYLADYAQSFPNVHPRAVMLERGREGQILTDSDFYEDAEMDRMPFYSELLPLLGFRHAMVAFPKKGRDAKSWFCFAVQYRKKDEVPAEDQRRNFSMLLPHLRRACVVEEKLRQTRRENAALIDALDHLSESVALLDASGRVVKANRSAQVLLEKGQGLSLGYLGRLILPNSETRSALERALHGCASASLLLVSDDTGPAPPILVPRPSGHPLVLTIQALPASAMGAYGAVALLFIADTAQSAAASMGDLRMVYGLSAAEAGLMRALAGGQRLKEYAQHHEVTYETARSRLREVFRKTGARRQAELVRLVERLPGARPA